MTLCRLSEKQAKAKLDAWVKAGMLVKQGEKRGTYYTLAASDNDPSTPD